MPAAFEYPVNRRPGEQQGDEGKPEHLDEHHPQAIQGNLEKRHIRGRHHHRPHPGEAAARVWTMVMTKRPWRNSILPLCSDSFLHFQGMEHQPVENQTVADLTAGDQ